MRNFAIFIVFGLVTTLTVEAANVDPDVFKVRRQALMEKLDGRVAVLYGAENQGGGVVEELFIQESNVYYLTGASEGGRRNG